MFKNAFIKSQKTFSFVDLYDNFATNFLNCNKILSSLDLIFM